MYTAAAKIEALPITLKAVAPRKRSVNLKRRGDLVFAVLMASTTD
jgi:hypothetical protein